MCLNVLIFDLFASDCWQKGTKTLGLGEKIQLGIIQQCKHCSTGSIQQMLQFKMNSKDKKCGIFLSHAVLQRHFMMEVLCCRWEPWSQSDLLKCPNCFHFCVWLFLSAAAGETRLTLATPLTAVCGWSRLEHLLRHKCLSPSVNVGLCELRFGRYEPLLSVSCDSKLFWMSTPYWVRVLAIVSFYWLYWRHTVQAVWHQLPPQRIQVVPADNWRFISVGTEGTHT